METKIGDSPDIEGTKEKNDSAVFLHDQRDIKKLFSGLKLAVSTLEEPSSQEQSSVTLPPSEDVDFKATVSDKMFCSYCNTSFANREEQIDHYKGDWHRFNLKQRLRNSNSVSEVQFEELLGGAGNLSSISGSDSSSDTHLSEGEEDFQAQLPSKVSEDDPQQTEERFHVEGDGRRLPKVFFNNHQGELLALYRCVLYGKKNVPESRDDLVAIAESMPDHLTWAVLMTAGGHFAGAIFEGDKILVHKTFHRYVIRAKRGTVQSTRDSQGNAPRSAGASLRRHNEAALTQEIQDTLDLWSDHLLRCDRIFIRGPSSNKMLYFGGKKHAIHKQDPRLRPIPFPTRRPTFREAQRVHSILSTVQRFGTNVQLTDHIKMSPKKTNPSLQKMSQLKKVPAEWSSHTHHQEGVIPKTVDNVASSEDEGDIELTAEFINMDTREFLQPFSATKKNKKTKNENRAAKSVTKRKSKGAEKDVDDDFDVEKFKLRNNLYTACKTGDKESLEELLKNMTLNHPVSVASESVKLDKDIDSEEKKEQGSLLEDRAVVFSVDFDKLLNDTFGDSQRGLLHIAAAAGQNQVIWTLLQAGADPTIKDRQGKVPYSLAGDKPTRNQFRFFMAAFPNKYDYVKAQIPGPLTEEMTAAKKAKEAEKKKVQRKARKEKQKEQKMEDAIKRLEDEEKQRFVKLSDREKRALAAERRLLAQCETQGKSLPTVKRCWQCGVDMTGSVPFEYYDFQFCTTKCLKAHKLKNSPS